MLARRHQWRPILQLYIEEDYIDGSAEIDDSPGVFEIAGSARGVQAGGQLFFAGTKIARHFLSGEGCFANDLLRASWSYTELGDAALL